MGMTMTQKILAAHAGLESVVAGQLIEADLDLVLGNDITSPDAIHEIEKMNIEGVFHKDKIALVMDHFLPNKDIKSAEHCKCVREFACKNEITNYFDVGEMGIEHALLPEKGLTVAGDVIIGADSHTCTYGALGAFSTGVGSTDMAAGMATGRAWFKVPSAIKVVITGKKHFGHSHTIIVRRAGVLGILEKAVLREGFVLRAHLVTESAGKKAHNRVRYDHGGKLAASQNVITEGKDLVGKRIHALIHALITPTHEEEAFLTGETLGLTLCEWHADRREEDDSRGMIVRSLNGVNSLEYRRRLHEHALATAKWRVIDRTMAIVCPVAKIMGSELENALLLSTSHDRGAKVSVKDARKYGEGFD